MGSFIEVVYTEFEKAAIDVDNYVAKIKQKMAAANNEVATLSGSWKGVDFQQFQSKWNELDDNGSTTWNMQKSLGNYAETLRYVAEQYKNAQKNAINRANSL